MMITFQFHSSDRTAMQLYSARIRAVFAFLPVPSNMAIDMTESEAWELFVLLFNGTHSS